MGSEGLLGVPRNAGRAIVEAGALFICPLLSTSKFVTYCVERGLPITQERLLLLERLQRFAPIFRVRTPPGRARHFRIPIQSRNNWFDKGWAWDTTSFAQSHQVPAITDRGREGYYSIFQLDHLELVLNRVTIEVQLDWHLETSAKPVDWNTRAADWLKVALRSPDELRGTEFRRAIGFLCQFVSERYNPYAQSDQRKMQIGRTYYEDQWVSALPDDDWLSYARSWDKNTAVNLYDLTPQKLRHAYETLAVAQEHIDPLARWHQLVQFVAVDQREKLKGGALLAETLRSAAFILRSLYRDLYGEELPHPNEVTGTIITHIPEVEVRQDKRRFLEFVVNRFHLNPQPLAAIIVEGPTEQKAIEWIYEKHFGSHPGRYGIEIIVLGGVDTATGTKEDRFRAILRLIDYLHHHQTMTFLVLDNERYARKLQAEAREAKSIHHTRRYVTRSDYVKVWHRSFEFDNYSNTELASALTVLSSGKVRFSGTEVETCKNHTEHGSELKRLFKDRTGKKLNKMQFAETLVLAMLSPSSRKKIANRPIVRFLNRVAGLVTRNPLPTMHESWELNQISNFFGKKRR